MNYNKIVVETKAPKSVLDKKMGVHENGAAHFITIKTCLFRALSHVSCWQMLVAFSQRCPVFYPTETVNLYVPVFFVEIHSGGHQDPFSPKQL